jgi:hypothetical protein
LSAPPTICKVNTTYSLPTHHTKTHGDAGAADGGRETLGGVVDGLEPDADVAVVVGPGQLVALGVPGQPRDQQALRVPVAVVRLLVPVLPDQDLAVFAGRKKRFFKI